MSPVGAELRVNLAVSLHALTAKLRDCLVLLNRKYLLAELIAACRTLSGVNNARHITFEYIMPKGASDSPADARALVRLLVGLHAMVNPLPFNAWLGAPFESSLARAIDTFRKILQAAGLAALVPTPRGRDMMAACGQLKSVSQQLKKADREVAQSRQGR